MKNLIKATIAVFLLTSVSIAEEGSAATALKFCSSIAELSKRIMIIRQSEQVPMQTVLDLVETDFAGDPNLGFASNIVRNAWKYKITEDDELLNFYIEHFSNQSFSDCLHFLGI